MERALLSFQALSDATRLRIVSLLSEMELSVGELAQVLGLSQPRISRHVKILVGAGLAERRREGSWVFLRLSGSAEAALIVSAMDALTQSEGERDWRDEDRERLAAIRADRARQAEAYFDRLADQWDAVRALHIAEPAVEDAAVDLLRGGSLGTLVDVGTGTGRMLQLFGQQADRAIGLDRSPEMLRLARAKLAEIEMAAELRQGDMYALPLADASADTVILHHLLHFAHLPDRTVAEAARLLRPGGRLLIVDFAAHEQETLRLEHNHVRLGFDNEQIARWFERAGLRMADRRSLPGSVLTVECWLGERPNPGLADRERRAA